MKKFSRPMTPEKIAEFPHEEIDYSDIPELDEEFWQNREVVKRLKPDDEQDKDDQDIEEEEQFGVTSTA